MSASKDVRKYLTGLEREGWLVRRGSKHFIVTAPNGERVVIACTPRSPHSLTVIKSHCRRAARVTKSDVGLIA